MHDAVSEYMRRLLAVLAALLIIVPLCGCISGGQQGLTPTITSPTVPPTSEPAASTVAPMTAAPETVAPPPTSAPATHPPSDCADSWPEFQNKDNHASSPCVIPRDLATLWNVQVDTILRYSLIIAERRVFASGDTALHCLDSETGELLWSYSLGNMIAGTPAYHDGCIYLGDSAGVLHCIDALTGVRIWTRQIDENPGAFSSILIAENRIYVTALARSAMCCINTLTGVIVWEHVLGLDFIGGDYTKMAFAEGLLYAPAGKGGVYCMDAATGAIVWNNDSYLLGNSIRCAVVAQDTVCVSTMGIVYGLTLDGDIKWSYNTGIPYGPLVSTDGTSAYLTIFKGPYGPNLLAGDIDTVDLVALDISTGEVAWEEIILDTLLAGAAPLVTPDLLIFVGRIGPDPRYASIGKDETVTYALIGMDRETHEVVRLCDVLETRWSGLAIANGRVFFHTNDGHVLCLG